MKVRAKTAFFNGGELKKRGDEFETELFDPILMTIIEDEAKAEEKKPAKKTRTSKR